jgi:hypothetical protein
MNRVLAVPAGLMAGWIVFIIVETITHRVYPPPPGFDPGNAEHLKAFVDGLPVAALLLLLLGCAVGAFAGGLVAARIHVPPSRRPGWFVGGILTLGGILNLTMVPHPMWFTVVTILVFLPLALAGAKAGMKKA